VEQWTINAVMQDGTEIVEATVDYGRFVALWISFCDDPDTVRLVWYALTLPSSAAAA